MCGFNIIFKNVLQKNKCLTYIRKINNVLILNVIKVFLKKIIMLNILILDYFQTPVFINKTSHKKYFIKEWNIKTIAAS